MATVFEMVEKVLSKKNHTLTKDEITLSELTLVKDTEGDSLLFSALGVDCILLADDRIAMIDDTNAEKVEIKYFEEEVEKELKEFLKWRMKFAVKFNL